MSQKSRSYSVFLLKEQFEMSSLDIESVLKQDHKLEKVSATKAPKDWLTYVTERPPRDPWWKSHFGITEDLKQAVQGALVFVPVDGRIFALSFGMGYHSLQDDCYEYDFGLRVTLNSVNPEEIRNTDIVEPDTSRRRRVQLPLRSELSYFDIDQDSTVLRALTGSVKAEYSDLFKHATGSSNLRLSVSVSTDEMQELLRKIKAIYDLETFKDAFPGLQNIVPIKDPVVQQELNDKLLAAIHAEDTESVSLTIPAIVDFVDGFAVKYVGVGHSDPFEDADFDNYRSYLKSRGTEISALTIADLRRHQLKLVPESGPTKSFSIYKSLIFESAIENNSSYHLNEGQWYKVEESYVENLRNFLNRRCKDLELPECAKHLEADYNAQAAKALEEGTCLDTTNISLRKQTQIEPCDILWMSNDIPVLTHVKIGTSSATLSHLFNQGSNSADLLIDEPASRDRLVAAIADRRRKAVEKASGSADEIEAARSAGEKFGENVKASIKERTFRVEFAIISKKDPSLKSDNLPLFSRVSLRRVLKDLDRSNVEAQFGFVADKTDR